MGSGSILLRDARITGNVAREGNGGGLLLQGATEVVVEGHNVIEFNSAAAEGGGIFSAVPLVMPDLGVANVAEGGYAKTVVSHNSAGSSGGGISTHGVMHMGLEHAIECRNNSAQLDGGALHLQNGARVEREAICGCPRSWNTDTFCSFTCQNAHCKPPSIESFAAPCFAVRPLFKPSTESLGTCIPWLCYCISFADLAGLWQATGMTARVIIRSNGVWGSLPCNRAPPLVPIAIGAT
eukprot:3332389-Rhodomonas_salina.1